MDTSAKSWKQIFLISSIIIAIAIVFHGLLLHGTATLEGETARNKAIATQTDPNEDGTFLVSTKNAPIWGEKNAPVTIIEFSDFECPFCSKAYNEILPKLKADYIDAGKLRFLYRNAPLEVHTHAKDKAVASLCVKELKGDEAFYRYHNGLYENVTGKESTQKLLVTLAKESGVDSSAFETCLKNEQKVKDQVDLDIAESYQLGANGTPTWFIGKTNANGDVIKGIRVVGTQPYSVYRILINQLLES